MNTTIYWALLVGIFYGYLVGLHWSPQPTCSAISSPDYTLVVPQFPHGDAADSNTPIGTDRAP